MSGVELLYHYLCIIAMCVLLHIVTSSAKTLYVREQILTYLLSFNHITFTVFGAALERFICAINSCQCILHIIMISLVVRIAWLPWHTILIHYSTVLYVLYYVLYYTMTASMIAQCIVTLVPGNHKLV